MKMEQEPLQLKSFSLSRTANGGVLHFPGTNQNFKLSSLQLSYLEVLPQAQTLEGLVNFFLGQGWLVQFRELFALVEFLVREDIIQNPRFKRSFQTQDLGAVKDLGTPSAKALAVPASSLPFFRSLDPSVAQYLLQDARQISVPAQTRVIQAGERSRDLYVLLDGEAGIYKSSVGNSRQRVASLKPGALFGERGFLLNQARTADIITTAPAEILRVPHKPEFDSFIKTEKAQSLQHRFWVLQALASSPIFKDLPGDSLDALIFSGRLLQAPAHLCLFQEGQVGNTCYVLIQGNAVVSQRGQNINVLTQGACFGEISLLVSGGVRTATITTQQPSVLLEIQQNRFYQVLAQNLFLAKDIEALAHQRLLNDAKRAGRV